MSLFSLFCSLLIGRRGVTVEVKLPTVALACASQRAFSYCWCGHESFLKTEEDRNAFLKIPVCL